MDDSISRADAIEAIRTLQTFKLFEGDDMILIDKSEVQTELMTLPSADRTGTWVVHDHGVTYWYKCNRCGGAGDKEDKFCKHCGAKMLNGGEK